jgi:hypothetical protein
MSEFVTEYCEPQFFAVALAVEFVFDFVAAVARSGTVDVAGKSF